MCAQYKNSGIFKPFCLKSLYSSQKKTHVLTLWPATSECIIPQSVTHSLALLKMGKIIARNMMSWLEWEK